MNTSSSTYQEVCIPSAGVPIVLSVWTHDPAATTVLFYPGTMANALCYEGLLQNLAEQGFNVVGLHPLSHGKSPCLNKKFTFDDMLQNGKDAALWASRHCSGPLVVCGHSQGGILTLAHASAPIPSGAPRLSAAFLLCTLLPQHPRAIELTLFRPFAPWHKKLLRAVRWLARLFPRFPVVIPCYLSILRIAKGGKDAVRVGTMRLSYPLCFIASLFSANLHHATRKGNICCPLEIISAQNDALFSPELMRCMLALIEAPAKKCVLLSGGGHLAPFVPAYAAQIARHMAQSCTELGLGLGTTSPAPLPPPTSSS